MSDFKTNDVDKCMEGHIQRSKTRVQDWVFPLISVAMAVVLMTLVFQAVQQLQLATIFQFFLPVPVIYVSLRHSSLWTGALTVIFATGAITLVSGYRLGLLFFLGTGFAALLMTLCFFRKYSATVAISCLTVYYLALGVLFVYLQQGVTFEAYIQGLMEIFKEQFIRIYEHQQIAWQNLEEQLDALARVLSMTFPLISALSTSVLMYGIARIMMKLGRIALAPLGNFHQWKVSEYLVWLFILGGGLYHLHSTRVFGVNLLLGLIFVYYLQGCAIITYFLKRRQTAKFLQFTAYLLLFLQIPYIFVSLGMLLTGYSQGTAFLPLPAILLVAGIGLVNVWFDFRTRVEQLKNQQ